MVSTFSVDLLKSIDSQSYSLQQIANQLGFESVEKMFELIKTLTKDDFELLLKQQGFRDAYHSFLFKLTELSYSVEYMTYINTAIWRNIKVVKSVINDNKKDKGSVYREAYKLLLDLEVNLNDIENQRVSKYETGNSLVFYHIIYELKNLDAVYYYITNHPDIVNLTYEDEPFLVYIIRNYLNEINNMSNEDIDYYERVITAIIYSGSIKIDRESYEELKKDIVYKCSKNNNNKKNKCLYIKYIFEKLDRFDTYEYKEPRCNIVIPKSFLCGRVDLRSLPTITIDFFKRFNGTKLLYDDAFSIVDNQDGKTTFYVHVPDVDEYIKDENELNEYIKNISQSRYAENNKLPMIPYNIAGKMSLMSNKDTACLTFKLTIDKNGNIINTDFMRSIVSVNQNLSINKAEDILRKGNEYSNILNIMYEAAKILKEKRKAKKDKRSKAGTIMDEFNIWTNIATASFFYDNNLLFPYKNLVAEDYCQKYQEDIERFVGQHELDKNASNLLRELTNVRSRYFYSTINKGFSPYNGLPYGSVGNPLREYMALETARVIKGLVICKDKNENDLREIVENDCIEQTELQARVKELYKTTK